MNTGILWANSQVCRYKQNQQLSSHVWRYITELYIVHPGPKRPSSHMPSGEALAEKTALAPVVPQLHCHPSIAAGCISVSSYLKLSVKGISMWKLFWAVVGPRGYQI